MGEGLKIRVTGASNYSRLIKAIIFGEPGAGKTLMSSTFPKPFYISAEGGLMSVADRQVPYAEIDSSQELQAVMKVLQNEVYMQSKGLEVQTVVVDTIDEIQRILIRERVTSQRQESMHLNDWGWLSQQMDAIVMGLRSLPYHVVFTCHVKETSDSETGRTWYKPGLSGQTADKIPGEVDLALAIEVTHERETNEEGIEVKMHRRLMTTPSRRWPFLKDRSGKLPEALDINFEDDFDRIYAHIYGNVDALPETEEIDINEADLVLGAKQPKKVNKAAAKKVAEETQDDPGEETESDDDTVKCDECGADVKESGIDPKLSQIRFRRPLCREHFDEEKTKRDTEK